jgi:hypothetical protein
MDVAEVVAELSRREQEGLRLFRPRPEQMPFFLSRASERLVRGGNRSGKTVAAAVEVASAAMGIPITGIDGEELPFHYPKRPLIIWIIGYDQKHIARMHRKLFRPGLFKVIKDKETGELRAWRPWEPEDAGREDETLPSPPLIPPRMAPNSSFGWESKAERVFNVCHLMNKTEIFAFPSGGEVGVGDAVDVIWIDEAIQIPSHVEEWQARLSDVRGKLVWSSWPKISNDALINMHRRAEREMVENGDDADVFEICLKFSDNPYIPEEEKVKRLKGWADAGDAVVAARDQGEFVTDSFLVFPTFNADWHGLPRRGEPDKFEQILTANANKTPDGWTHYLTLDPGHTTCGVLVCAVPPPEVGDYVYAYGELYLKSAEADDVAAAIQRKWPNTRWEAFIVDWHAARQTPMGFGITVHEKYVEAFERVGLKCRQTGSEFLPGSDNIAARNMIVRQWLAKREDGTSKFRCNRQDTPHLQEEFVLYKKKATALDVQEDVVAKHDHLMGCLGYLASRNPEYVSPWGEDEPKDPVDRFLRNLRIGPGQPDDDSFYMGAGSRPLAVA